MKSVLTGENMSDNDSSGGNAEVETEEKKPIKLTDEQWAEARTLCETGVMRGSEIARKFGVTASAVSQHFTANGVTFGSKRASLAAAVTAATAGKIAETVAPFAAKRVERIEETKSQHYQYSAWIAQETMRLIAEAKKGGHAISTVANDIKTLRFAAATLATTRLERYTVLEADKHTDVDELPSIEIIDLTDQQIKALRDAALMDDLDIAEDLPQIEDDDNEIVVIK